MIAVERKRAETGAGESNRVLAEWVDQDTMIMAGFNYYEKSLHLDNGMWAYIVDQDTFSSKSLNIVILEDQKRKGAIKWKEWHFGTFKGKPRSERKADDIEDYDAQLEKIARQDSIKGYELMGKLQDVIDQIFGGAE